ncbi:MAG: DUF3429 domain-containing protein [Paracoccaceae bacterium]|jgi:hypothetical protein|nr:DUF3429 domain-containing protein [Paracoccaceae bacterium]NDH26597.1 DUF3429 domain-containing protein [Paracoccaceae bacterium]|tara:strand:- start:3558 stop:4010 length:453 start_codon:yes stop_codon:yes gene_type:complete
MADIPRSALYLGLAGVLPFLWGVLTLYQPSLSEWTIKMIGPRFVGPYVQLFYGAVILSFMSGVLWGFATKAEGKEAAIGYTLSVVPALWAFFMTGGGPEIASRNLIAGFIGLLALDWYFWSSGQAPVWWMRLRLLLTGLVVLCLFLGKMP